MVSSKEKDTLLKCISAGVLPEVLQRDDVALEVVKRREQGSSLYLDKETGELVSYAEMKARGGAEKRISPSGGTIGSQRVPNVQTNAHWEKGGSSRSRKVKRAKTKISMTKRERTKS